MKVYNFYAIFIMFFSSIAKPSSIIVCGKGKNVCPNEYFLKINSNQLPNTRNEEKEYSWIELQDEVKDDMKVIYALMGRQHDDCKELISEPCNQKARSLINQMNQGLEINKEVVKVFDFNGTSYYEISNAGVSEVAGQILTGLSATLGLTIICIVCRMDALAVGMFTIGLIYSLLYPAYTQLTNTLPQKSS